VLDMIDLAKQDAAQNKGGSAIAFVGGLFPRVVGLDRRDGRADQGGQPRLRPDRDAPFWKQRLIALLLVVATGLVSPGCSC
jgi:hypothetical protein